MNNDIPAVYQEAPWFIPGTTDPIAMTEQALTWLLDNPTFAREYAPEYVTTLMEKPGPERMARWLIEHRRHVLDYRRRRAAFLALGPDDPVSCPCRFGVGMPQSQEKIPLSSCDCKRQRHPAFQENNSTTK